MHGNWKAAPLALKCVAWANINLPCLTCVSPTPHHGTTYLHRNSTQETLAGIHHMNINLTTFSREYFQTEFVIKCLLSHTFPMKWGNQAETIKVIWFYCGVTQKPRQWRAHVWTALWWFDHNWGGTCFHTLEAAGLWELAGALCDCSTLQYVQYLIVRHCIALQYVQYLIARDWKPLQLNISGSNEGRRLSTGTGKLQNANRPTSRVEQLPSSQGLRFIPFPSCTLVPWVWSPRSS